MCNWKSWIWPGILTVAILSALALWMKTDFIETDLQAKATKQLAENGQSWAQISMDGRDATLVGDAPSEAAQSEAEFITDEAYSVRVVNNRSALLAAQSPYTFTATRTGNAIDLTGYVPDETARATVLASVKEALPGLRVTDTTQYARGAPEGFTALSGFAFTQLKGLRDGNASMVDGTLSVEGTANTLEDFEGINTALAAALPGGGQLGTKNILAPVVSPYTWQANFEGQSVTLGGFVPNQETADSLVAKAKETLPEAEIIDEQKLASGGPEGFLTKAEFALAQLGAFSDGEVSLSDNTLNVKGNSQSPQQYAESRLALMEERLPSGLVIGEEDIQIASVSPYTWQATKTKDGITLTGHVPDDETRAAIVAKAASANAQATVTDNMQLATGAVGGFEDRTSFALDQLGGLTAGTVAVSDADYFIKGAASDVDTYEALTSATVGTLPASLALGAADITPAAVSPYAWGADYDGRTVTLSGVVPDDATREKLNADAKAALPGANVQDDMRTAVGQGDGFATNAGFALGQLSGLTSGKVGLSDGSLSIEGIASTPETYAAAKTDLTTGLPATIAAVTNRNITPPSVSPYIWGADYDGENVSLTGSVPDDATRQSIAASVKSSLPDANINDNTTLALGAPQGFGASAEFAASQLSQFSNGSVSLEDSALSVEGVSRDVDAFDASRVALTALPEGLTLAKSDVRPSTVSPYEWSASRDGNAVTLGGFAPSADAKRQAVEGVKTAIPGAAITDNMRVAAGAPADFDSQVAFATKQLPLLSSGQVSLQDGRLNIEGDAASVGNYASIQDQLGDLPNGLTLADQKVRSATVSPYSWGADFDGDTVKLNGFVPSEAARSEIVAATNQRLPGRTVQDDMMIASGAPDGFTGSASAAIGLLPRLKSGNIALSNENLTVEGEAKDSGSYNAALRAVESRLPDTVKLASADITPPQQQGDYTFTAKKSDTSLVLSGQVGSLDQRKALGDRAKTDYPNRTIVNRLTVAAGQPDTYEANVGQGLDLLANLKTGTASVVNDKLTVDGEAASVAAYGAAIAAQGDVAGTIKPASISPYSWGIDNTGEQTVLSGFVPYTGAGNALAAAAKATLGNDVDNTQRVAAGEPDGFGNATAALIASVNQLENGRATLTDRNAFIQGRADSEEEATRIGDDIAKSLPDNYTLRRQISYILPLPETKVELKEEFKPAPVPDPVPEVTLKQEFVPKPVEAPQSAEVKDAEEPATEQAEVKEPEVAATAVCDVDFPALFAGERILFDTAKADIKPASFPLLDRLAKGISTCKSSIIEIGGHTDSRGSARYNQALSEARAQSVLAYLTMVEGVGADNLSAKGYGESQPLVSNQGLDRSKNRRIEFKVIKDQ